MSKIPTDYSAYSATDFVLDPDFVRWVQSPTEEDLKFWDKWLIDNPVRRNTVTDARALILHIRFGKDYNSDENIEHTWKILSAKFDNRKEPVFAKILNLKVFLRYAAAITFIGIASFVAFRVLNASVTSTYKTGNGEISKIKLSDSTEIILNANSSLKVVMTKGFVVTGTKPTREAWLTGEAFFKVSKKKIPQKFTVHTSNIDVNVIGTEFNVADRHHLSTVVLNSGVIKINNTIGQLHEKIMKPGDLISFSDTSSSLNIKFVNPENYYSWIYQKLIFEHTPIADVAHLLEDTYGLSVVISKPALTNKTFTATLPSNNLPVLLKAIEESFNVNIKQLDKKLIITDNSL